MPKRTEEYYVPGTCNTTDDVTGFKEKFCDQVRRWDNVYTTEEQWNPRQPQDFPPVIRPRHVEKNARPVKQEIATPISWDPI